MLSAIARILLIGTALAPVGFAYSWIAFVQGDGRSGVIILGISILLCALCFALLWSAPQSLPASEFKANSVEAADHENIAFLLLYAMPLFTSQFSTLDWRFWIPTGALVAIIGATGYTFHFNPLLGILGWHFYKVQSAEGVSFVLITKKQLRQAAAPIRVGQLTEYVLLDLGDR